MLRGFVPKKSNADFSVFSPLYRQSGVTLYCKICKKWLGIKLPSHVKTLLYYSHSIVPVGLGVRS